MQCQAIHKHDQKNSNDKEQEEYKEWRGDTGSLWETILEEMMFLYVLFDTVTIKSINNNAE